MNQLMIQENRRLFLQINRNIFYEYEQETEYCFQWPCGFVWDKNHRLYWESIPVKNLRLFDPQIHQNYIKNSRFLINQYLYDLKRIKIKLDDLERIKKCDGNFDTRQPHRIDLSKSPSWIKNKFLKAAKLQEMEISVIGKEYKLFENLMIKMDWDCPIMMKLWTVKSKIEHKSTNLFPSEETAAGLFVQKWLKLLNKHSSINYDNI